MVSRYAIRALMLSAGLWIVVGRIGCAVDIPQAGSDDQAMDANDNGFIDTTDDDTDGIDLGETPVDDVENSDGGETITEDESTGESVDDLWTTVGGGETLYTGFQTSPIPAEFFSPSSDPFDGVLALQGKPLVTDPPGALGPSDLIIRRHLDDCPNSIGDTLVVDAEIAAVSWVATSSITVTEQEGGNSQQWNVYVRLSHQSQPMGSITMRRDTDAGGRFDYSIPAALRFVFTRVADGTVRSMDCGETGATCDVIRLEGIDLPWVLADSPSAFASDEFGLVQVTSGIRFEKDEDPRGDGETVGPSNCFVAGIEAVDAGYSCVDASRAELRAAENSDGQVSLMISSSLDTDGDGRPDACDRCPNTASAEFADNDDDGIGNACDNCPDTANADQADTDGDGIGGACDNCPDVANSDQQDTDGDGIGNVCDNCPSAANSSQADDDQNGVGNACAGGMTTFQMVGQCEDSDGLVSWGNVDGQSILSGLEGNGDIVLTVLGDTLSTADDVWAFGLPGAELTLIEQNGSTTLGLFHPETGQACSVILVPLQ